MQSRLILDFLWEDGNTSLADAILERAKELLSSGEQIGSVTSATENGKSVQRNIGMSAEAAYTAASNAKKWYAKGYHEIPRQTVGVFC